MKKLLTILALLATASFALAAFQGLPDHVQKNLGAIQKYPKASSILLWVKDGYTLQADGSKLYDRHEFRYLPDEAARDNYGDPHVPYVSGRDTLEILTARCYTSDGRRIDATPHNAFNPIIPEGGLGLAPDYSDFRQMVVTILGLENGAIAELHYRVTTYTPQFPWLEGRVYFREESPVIARELTVTVPETATLMFVGDRGVSDPTVSGGAYKWTMGEQAGYLAEDLGGHRVLLPNVAFSTAKDWEQIRTALRDRVNTAISGELALPASLKSALIGQTTDEAKLTAIKSWVHERFPELHDGAYHHADLNFVLRPAVRVLQSGYGNDFEVAVLVATFAALAHIEVDVVPFFVPESPVPFLHEYAGTLLSLRGQSHPLYVHPRLPAGEFNGADIVGAWLLPLAGDPKEPAQYTSRVKNPGRHLFIYFDDITADTLTGHGTLTSTGEWGIYEALREGGPVDYLNGAVHARGFAVTKATVRDLEHPSGGGVAVEFTFTAAGCDTADGARVLPLALWDFQMLTTGAPLGLTKREFRQEVPLPAEISLRVEAPVPEKWQVSAHPQTKTQAWDFDRGIVSRDVTDGRFIFERTLKLTKDWIPPESWSDYRAFVLGSGPNAGNCTIFSPAKVAAAK